MQVKSNIMPISNIYPINETFVQDTNFHKQVRGKPALVEMIKHIKGMHSAFGFHIDEIKHLLSPQQVAEFDSGTYCSLLGDKAELVFGYVKTNDILLPTCRCYNTECRHFSTCRPGTDKEVIKAEHTSLLQSLTEVNFQIPNHSKKAYEEDFDRIGKTKQARTGNVLEVHLDLEEIVVIVPDEGSQTVIIEGSPDRCLMVSAGPGTGKTYSLIEKIKYMAENYDLSPANDMLVLCFTKSAVKEIKERFYKEIKDRNLHGDLAYLEIKTFDSFATAMLNYCGKDVTGKDYDERIQMAIQLLDEQPEILDNFKHIFVDEIQDLVGLRARFVKAILERISGGFTLLGDPMQGIYDYQISNEPGELDSVGFSRWLQEHFGPKIETASLSKNRRQNQKLTSFSVKSRKLLDGSNAQDIEDFLKLINDLPSRGSFHAFDLTNTELSDSKIALLCRDNGEVLKMSGYLRKRGISHIVKRQNNYPVLPSWLSSLMSSSDQIITFAKLKRFNDTYGYWQDEEMEYKYNLLRSITGYDHNYIDKQKLFTNLVREHKVPEELYEESDAKLSVSTIHQSKGREFDKVLVVRKSNRKEDSKTFEEAKVYYVAITRAKSELNLIESDTRNTLSKSESGRWYQTHYYGGKKKLNSIEFGLNGDIEPESFVGKDSLSAANQTYIKEQVKPGGEISLYLNEQHFDIVHNGTVIGQATNQFYLAFKQAIKEIYGSISYFPVAVECLYVDKLYTIIRRPETLSRDVPEPYSSLGVWLGVQVIGLGTIRWAT